MASIHYKILKKKYLQSETLLQHLKNPNIRVLSVRQPWAWAIVNGYKTLENRKSKIPSTIPLPSWIIIHASSTKYSKIQFQKEMQLLKNELQHEGYSDVKIPEPNSFRYGEIVGAAEFFRCGTVPLDLNNIWWHHDNYVYEIGSTVLFKDTHLKAKGQLGFGKLIRKPELLKQITHLFQ